MQKELKLTDDQIKTVAELRQKLNVSGPGGVDFNATSPAARHKANTEQQVEVTRAFDKLLTLDQRKRLQQIERQQWQGPGLSSAFFQGNALAKELAVTDAQRAKYEEVEAAHGEVVVKAILSGEPFEKVSAAVEASRAATEKATLALLTADQQAKHKEFMGEPFKGNVYGGFPGGPGGGGPGVSAATLRKLYFGRYSGQITTLVRFKGVQEELKLTEEQLKKLIAANTELRTKFPPGELAQAAQDEKKGDKLYADRSAFIEKVLADVLTKEQRARFRELELQQLGAATFPGTPVSSAAGYPGVAEAIKLTVDQKKKLLDGEPPVDVLTADQKKAITAMHGEAVKLAEVFNQPAFPGPGGGFNLLPTLTASNQLLLNVVVWDALKLTPDQLAKLVPVANEYLLVAGPRRGGFGGGPGGGGFGQPVNTKERVAVIEKFTAAVDATLTAEQKKRLSQLAIQQAASNGLDSALTNQPTPSELAKGLALTDAQRKKVEALSEEFSNVANLLDETSLAWEKEMTVRTQLRERLDTAVLKELTVEQKAKLKELTGEPFEGFTRQPYYGSRGGFGGGFGGFFP